VEYERDHDHESDRGREDEPEDSEPIPRALGPACLNALVTPVMGMRDHRALIPVTGAPKPRH
jgi:hypothetical protein